MLKIKIIVLTYFFYALLMSTIPFLFELKDDFYIPSLLFLNILIQFALSIIITYPYIKKIIQYYKNKDSL